MKRYILLLLSMAVLLVACQREEEALVQKEEPTEASWTLTVRAVQGIPGEAGNETKAVAIGEGDTEANTQTLKSYWMDGERVNVYLDDAKIGSLTAHPDEADAHYATLEGTVTTSSISAGTTRLTLLTVDADNWTYTGQEGRLLWYFNDNGNSISSKYSVAKAENVLVTAVSGESITTEPATFANQQSIYRLSFRFQKNGVGDKIPINVQRVILSAKNGGLWRNVSEGTGPITVVIPSATTEPFFVALRNTNTTSDEVLNFQVIGSDGFTYLGSKSIPAAYMPWGTFVSIKNTTLTSRLGVPLISETVNTAL